MHLIAMIRVKIHFNLLLRVKKLIQMEKDHK